MTEERTCVAIAGGVVSGYWKPGHSCGRPAKGTRKIATGYGFADVPVCGIHLKSKSFRLGNRTYHRTEERRAAATAFASIRAR